MKITSQNINQGIKKENNDNKSLSTYQFIAAIKNLQRWYYTWKATKQPKEISQASVVVHSVGKRATMYFFKSQMKNFTSINMTALPKYNNKQQLFKSSDTALCISEHLETFEGFKRFFTRRANTLKIVKCLFGLLYMKERICCSLLAC